MYILKLLQNAYFVLSLFVLAAVKKNRNKAGYFSFFLQRQLQTSNRLKQGISKKLRYKLFYLSSLLILFGCHQKTYLAPVEELKWHSYLGQPVTHIVRPNETIYAIAFRYDLDFREVIKYNHLQQLQLYSGQRLRLPSYQSNLSAGQHNFFADKQQLSKLKIIKQKKANNPFNRRSQPFNANKNWNWPAQGQIIYNFSPNLGKKGIDIAGKKGSKVFAALDGIVAYAGNGLAGYGNLIIIKHTDQLITAYGNNLANKVHEGQVIKAGQVIADMGIVERRFWGVHFEIRKAGQPVDPIRILPKLND